MDNLSVLLNMHRRWDVGYQMGDIRNAANALQMVVLECEFVGNRHLVYGLAPLEQREAGLKTPAVLLTVEVRRFEERRDSRQRLAVDEDGADDRLLRTNIVGRKNFSNQ